MSKKNKFCSTCNAKLCRAHYSLWGRNVCIESDGLHFCISFKECMQCDDKKAYVFCAHLNDFLSRSTFTWQILSWRLKIPVTCSTKFQVHLTMKVSYFEYRKVTKYIYINYIYTAFIITRERNCYSTLLGTINVETSSNSIPIDFSRSKLSTTGGHWRSKKYLSKPLR